MRIPELAIKNYPFTLVVTLLLAIIGVSSFLTMPRAENPQFDLPIMRVYAVYPGANPEDIESLVVDPIEESINEIEDLDRIETSIQDGVAVIRVEFVSGTDPDDALEDVTQAVNNVRGDLPDGLRALEVFETSPSDVNILQVALVSETATYRRLEQQAERLEKAFERVSGVKRADTWAYPQQQVRVGLDLEKLRETGIGFNDVIGAVQSSAENIPGGDLDVGPRRFNIQTSGDYASVEDIQRTIVGRSGDRLVYLRDVAEVGLNYEDDTYRARLNGERAVFVTAVQRKGVNIFDVMAEINAERAGFEAQLPGDIRLETVFDQSEGVESSVNGFFISLLQGILVVGLVIILALGLRAASIVMLAIPLSILIAISWVDFSGYGLQQISIVGLVIALGLLVDNAIVVTENVARYLNRGYRSIEAATKGTGEVGWAVVSATTTSVLAFLPIVLVQSGSGDFIRSMPVTVIYALVASLLISLTLTPFLASRFLQRSRSGAPGRVRRLLQRAGIGRTGAHDDAGNDEATRTTPETPTGPLQKALQRIVDGPYRRTLGWALAHPFIVLLIAGATFAGSLALFPLIGVSLFPEAEKAQFLVNVETPEGSSLDYTDAAVRRVERVVDTAGGVRRHAANVGRDNPLVYYNEIPRREKSTVGQVYVEVDDPRRVPDLADALEADLARTPGVEYTFSIFKNGPPVEAPIAIKVIGPDLNTLDGLAAEVEALVRQTTGTENIQNPLAEPKTDLHVNIDRDKAGMLGVRLVDVDRTVRAAMAGLSVAQYRDADGEDYDIVMRLPHEDRPAMSDFDRISVTSMAGGRIPLRQIADVELEAVPTRIDHFDTERAVTITADVDTRAGYNAINVTQDVIRQLDARTWPGGYRYFVGGELEAQEESFSSLTVALIGAVLGILAVLVLQFGSFSQPLIVFTAIPLSVIGAFPALLLTGYTFSFTAFVGFTSLVGIVVNNSIILVDYANQLMAEGKSILDAVREAGETRFVPILLTTLTTIGGLLPLTLTNTELWSPLGWVIIGGLIGSTLLTLIVVPVLYALFTRADRAAAAA